MPKEFLTLIEKRKNSVKRLLFCVMRFEYTRFLCRMSLYENRYFDALFTSLLSIGPIILLVCILSWTPILNFGTNDYVMLLFGGVALILGLALFQIGASAGLTKVGEYMGSSLSRQKQLFVIIIFSFALGVLITCAEPSLLIVSKQVTIVPNNEVLNTIILIGSIAIGVGAFVVIGILRIILHKPLKLWVMFFYLIIFLLVCLIALDPERAEMLPFIFDSYGVTTGSATAHLFYLWPGVAVVRGGKQQIAIVLVLQGWLLLDQSSQWLFAF